MSSPSNYSTNNEHMFSTTKQFSPDYASLVSNYSENSHSHNCKMEVNQPNETKIAQVALKRPFSHTVADNSCAPAISDDHSVTTQASSLSSSVHENKSERSVNSREDRRSVTSKGSTINTTDGGGGSVTKPRRVRHAKLSEEDFSRKCVVCGDKAYNYNYGCICCESCKMFFRRNSWKSQSLTCALGKLGFCQMAVDKRRSCAACRLKKCLDSGMIREFNSYETAIQQTQAAELSNNKKKDSSPVHSTPSQSTSQASPATLQLDMRKASSSPPQAISNVSWTGNEGDNNNKWSTTLSLQHELSFSPAEGRKQAFLARQMQTGDLVDSGKHLCFGSRFTVFREQFQPRENDILEIFLQHINQHFHNFFISPENAAPTSAPAVPSAANDQALSLQSSLHLPWFDHCLFTQAEVDHVKQLGENAYHHFCKVPYPSSFRRLFLTPGFGNLITAAEEFTKRTVIFCKTLPTFSQLTLAQQKLLITIRTPSLVNMGMLWSFELDSCLYRFPLDDNSILYVDLKKSFSKSFQQFPEMSLQDEMLTEYARLIGKSKIGLALLVILKTFEIRNCHYDMLDPVLIQTCQNTFHFYGCLLFKFLWLQFGPEGIHERWQHLMDALRFSRHKFDKTATRVVMHASAEPCESELLMELSHNLVNINSQIEGDGNEEKEEGKEHHQSSASLSSGPPPPPSPGTGTAAASSSQVPLFS